MKARLVEADIFFKRTHDLAYLLNLALRVEPLWKSYEEELRLLTDYGVEFRYPGASADRETAQRAMSVCRSFRLAARARLSLPSK